MKNRLRVAMTALALVMGLAGCATATPTKDDAPKAGTNADKKPTAKSAAKPKAKQPDLSSLHFGDTAKWPNGLTITVSKPTAFTPSDTSMGGGKHNLRMTLTVVNGTPKPIEPILISTSMQSGDKEAEPVFDSAKGIEAAPSTKLLKGRQAKWDIAFAVKNPRDLVLEVGAGDFTSDSAIFTS
jgi:hypothetical protein